MSPDENAVAASPTVVNQKPRAHPFDVGDGDADALAVDAAAGEDVERIFLEAQEPERDVDVDDPLFVGVPGHHAEGLELRYGADWPRLIEVCRLDVVVVVELDEAASDP